MIRYLLASVLVALPLAAGTDALAQRTPGGLMRIVVLVDSSSAISSMLTTFRASLNTFLDAVPGDPEIAIISTGGQLRIRVEPTSDRLKLHAGANAFASDGGGNTLLETLLEADRRFMKSAPDRRPVFVILSTDLDGSVADSRTDLYNKFVDDFLARRGRAHAIIIGGLSSGITTRIAENLTRNTNGFYATVQIANGVPKLMKTLADYVAADQ